MAQTPVSSLQPQSQAQPRFARSSAGKFTSGKFGTQCADEEEELELLEDEVVIDNCPRTRTRVKKM